MTSEDAVEDPLMSVQFYVQSKTFFIPCYSPSTVFFLLQKTLKSVFLPRYESLKLKHDTSYLMTSEDTVEDRLLSVQFYIKSKSFFISCYSPSIFFSFLLQKTLESVFLPRHESLKKNYNNSYLMKSEDTVEDPLMSVQFYIKSKSFFISCYTPSTVFFLLQKTLKSVFLPRYESLKLKHDTSYLMTSEDKVGDPLVSVHFYIKSKSFFISCYSPSTVFFLLQKTLKSVFLPRYESLKLKLDTSYLMTSQETVEDPLMIVQFYIKSKSFFISCYSPSTVFFLLQKTLKSVFLPRHESLKLKHDTSYLMTSEDTVGHPLMSVHFYIKSKSFFISCYSPSTVFFLLQKTLKSVFLPRYEPLKLKHDTSYLMTSEDTVEDPLMSVQFYIKSKSFFISCYSPSIFSFLLQKTLESVFLPRYESLKLKHDNSYLMKSKDKVEDPLMSVQFYIKSKSFFISCYSPSTVFYFIAKDAKICISTTL